MTSPAPLQLILIWLSKVIVRFNRSGNRSNDQTERTIKTRPMQNRSIAGGEGHSSSLRSRSAGYTNVSKHLFLFDRSVNRSVVSLRFGGVGVSCCFCGVKVIVRFDRSGLPSKRRTTDHSWLAFLAL